MLYKPGPYKNSFVRREGGESRDLKAVCDNLEKELERKECRNDILSRELLSLRASFANQQREQRIVTGTFEKLNTERTSLLNESIKSKEHIAKLEVQLARLSDSQVLLDHMGRQQQIIDNLQGKLDKSQSSLVLKDDVIKSLEKELDTLHRAFDVQDRYETPRSSVNTSTSSIQVDREKMRSLYYELGKRQSDAHSLTLTLADSSIEMGKLKQNLKELLALKAQMEENGINQRTQYEKLLADKNILLGELSANQDNTNKIKDWNSKLSGQIEDLSKRLSELRASSDLVVTEKETLVFELSSLLYASQLEVVSLNTRVDELKQSVTLLQSSTELSEQRSASHLNKAIAERQVLTELLQEAELMKPELYMVHQHLEDAVQEHEEKNKMLQDVRHSSEKNIAQARRIAEELQRELSVTQQLLETAQTRENDLEEEKTNALSTLQRTLEAAKSLSSKLQSEKEKRVVAEERANKAERLADTLQRAKEHVSSAVLDALHLEKSKSIRLEKVLQQMTSSRDFIPHPRAGTPGSSSLSPVRGERSDAGRGDDYEGRKPASFLSQSLSSGNTSSPPRRLGGELSNTHPSANAIIAEYKKNIPSFSLSSPSRTLSAHSQSVLNRSRDIKRESWRLMERAIDSGVDMKLIQECRTDGRDERLRASNDGDNRPREIKEQSDIDTLRDTRLRDSSDIDKHDRPRDSHPNGATRSLERPWEDSELRLSASKVLALGSPSRSMVDGLTRLRYHLREIEEGLPSPLDQSRSILLSASKQDNNHRYAGVEKEYSGGAGNSANGEEFELSRDRAVLSGGDGQQTSSGERSAAMGDVHGQQTGAYNQGRGRDYPSVSSMGIRQGASPSIGINGRNLNNDTGDVNNNNHHFHNSNQNDSYHSHNSRNSNSSHNDNHFEVSDEEISLFDLAK